MEIHCAYRGGLKMHVRCACGRFTLAPVSAEAIACQRCGRQQLTREMTKRRWVVDENNKCGANMIEHCLLTLHRINSVGLQAGVEPAPSRLEGGRSCPVELLEL